MKLFGLLFSFIPLLSYTQTSTIQSKSGETSLILAKNNTIIFNSSDASIGANFSFNHAIGEMETFWGFSLKVKSNEGVSKLIDGYDFKPKFDAGLFRGRYIKSLSKSVSQYYYYSIAVNNSYFNLLNANLINKLDASTFFGWRVKSGYNRIGVIGKNSTLWGVSIEGGRYNNTEDLKSIDRFESTMDASTAPSTIVLSNKKSAFKGLYLEESMARLNFDYLFYPRFGKSRFAIGGLYRGGFGGEFARQNLGFGIFLTKDEAPDKIVLGIVYQINDIFNQLKEESALQKRTGVNLTAGYNF